MILHQKAGACINCSMIASASWCDDDPEPDLECPNHPHLRMNSVRRIDSELDPELLVP